MSLETYLKEYTKQQSEEFDFLNLPEHADEFIGGWLLENGDERETWKRKVRVTIAFVPTDEEYQKAKDEQFFDDEYS